MPPGQIYVCDADCLINLHRHLGKVVLKVLRGRGKQGGLKLPEGVIRELVRGTDKLARFLHEGMNRQNLEISVHQFSQLHDEIPRLERLYGETICVGSKNHAGFWRSKAGRKAADAQVIAVAKLLKGVAVSDDEAVKLACALEGVPCIGWAEFARQLGLIKPKQLPLDLERTS